MNYAYYKGIYHTEGFLTNLENNVLIVDAHLAAIFVSRLFNHTHHSNHSMMTDDRYISISSESSTTNIDRCCINVDGSSMLGRKSGYNELRFESGVLGIRGIDRADWVRIKKVDSRTLYMVRVNLLESGFTMIQGSNATSLCETDLKHKPLQTRWGNLGLFNSML